MCSAFGSIDIINECKNRFVVRIIMLECNLNIDSVLFPLKIENVFIDGSLTFIQVLNVFLDTAFIVEFKNLSGGTLYL